jgi:uncharacterized protein YcaQ
VPRERLSAAAARRVALAAQGFADPAPSVPDRRSLNRVLRRTGLLQIDSVNVLVRAHYLPVFSRIGPYPRELVDTAAYRRPRALFEYWGHEASLLPVDTQPLWRWRMADVEDHAWSGMKQVMKERPDLVRALLHDIRDAGPLTASQLAARHDADRPRRSGPWWDWSDVKRALEFMFWAGEVTTATRKGFERVYDLPERVLPRAVVDTPTPDRADAQRELMRRAARSLGVSAARELRDYYRLPAAEAKLRLAELVESGELAPVTVDGWNRQAYLHRDVVVPRQVEACALLVPFDPLVWERDRTLRLFDFHYRIEIYTPAHKRVHGYYVLPFLLGDRLVARVDLKADRGPGVLRVHGAFTEPHAPAETAQRLVDQLQSMAAWLGLSDVSVAPNGDLADALRRRLG